MKYTESKYLLSIYTYLHQYMCVHMFIDNGYYK